MTLTRAGIGVLAVLVVLSLVAASPGRYGKLGPPAPQDPFGSIVFDILPTYPPTAAPGQLPQYPLWGSPTPACNNDTSAPALSESDDPETWVSIPSTWGGHDAVALEFDTLTGGGLITYYYLNSMKPSLVNPYTHLYIGATGAGATFDYAISDIEGTANYQQLGTTVEQNFLTDIETGSNYHAATAGTGPTPSAFFATTIPSTHLATGEVSVTNLSAPTTFYIYADACQTPCPSINNVAADDTFHRRGLAAGAAMTIQHDYTPQLQDQGSGWAYWDLGQPTPGPTGTPPTWQIDYCATPLPLDDHIDNRTMDGLKGWYGVPITITGQAKYYVQYWYLNPQGPGDFNAAVWINGMVDSSTGMQIPTGAYSLPYPSASPTPWIGDNSHAFVLGQDNIGVTRTIIYVPSPGGFWPVRFYYLDPVAQARRQK